MTEVSMKMYCFVLEKEVIFLFPNTLKFLQFFNVKINFYIQNIYLYVYISSMYTYLCYATFIRENICKFIYLINVYAFICECEMLRFMSQSHTCWTSILPLSYIQPIFCAQIFLYLGQGYGLVKSRHSSNVVSPI